MLACGGWLAIGIVVGGVIGWLIGAYSPPPGSPPE